MNTEPMPDEMFAEAGVRISPEEWAHACREWERFKFCMAHDLGYFRAVPCLRPARTTGEEKR